MKYKISQHLLILYGLTEPSDLISYSLIAILFLSVPAVCAQAFLWQSDGFHQII